MNKIEINVVDDILESTMALHEFGRPVSRIIDQKLSTLKEHTLFVINLRGADPIDYEFVYVAFTSIILKYLGDPNVFLVFKAGRWEAEELFTGITKILKIKKEIGKSDKDTLIEKGINLIVINDHNAPTYVTALSEKHLKILNEIERGKEVSSADIKQTFNLIVEETSQILTDLLKSKFIYATDGPLYQSIISLV